MEHSATQAFILVSGRVQGVYFRAHAKEQALALNLTGYAKNLPDGRVEIIAKGGEVAVKKLIAWCHQGSPSAKVEKVETNWQRPDYMEQGFAVR